MNSSGSGAADCSVGSIVWVRRRNGSWWPGKILDADELESCHLTSPRSGTPVKLLGREDASVDWYNLEKSKRVKAFRCGEFDDCIERAESSHGIPIKKREKYARREDAILHALELEKQQLRKQGKLDLASDNTRSKPSGSVKESATSSEHLRNCIGKPGSSKSTKISKRVDTTVKDEIISNLSFPQKAKDGNLPSWEDDHTEVTPRMRGLQDFGIRTGPLKRKLSPSVSSDASQKLPANDHTKSPSGASKMGRTDSANEMDQTRASFRAKRSKCVYLPDLSSDSLDSKEVPPGDIEISASQLGDDDGCPHPDSLAEENASELSEDVESDSTESDASESETDSSKTEPDINETTVHSGSAAPAVAELHSLGLPEVPGEHRGTSSEEPDESELSGEMFQLHPDDFFHANEAVSKWQLKGKRNIRNFTKKSLDVAGEKGFNGSIHGTTYGMNRTNFGQRVSGQSLRLQGSDYFDDDIDDIDFDEKDFGTHMVGLYNRGYSYASMSVPMGRNSSGCTIVDSDDQTWEGLSPWQGQWKDSRECFDAASIGRHHLGGRSRSILFDVDLKVQASYQKGRVPIVSLMSKLNGKAIIGHPIQIEVMENGSTENLLSTTAHFGNGATEHDGNTVLPQAWRTARRTNSRVPRPLSSSLDCGDAADGESRPQFKKSNSGNFNKNTSLFVKKLPQISRPPADRKIARKPMKKVSLSSSQKTRTLSSIATEQHLGKPIHGSSNCQIDGLLKQESSGPPTVACIPVKLVFSRLLEKINRPPLKAARKVVFPNNVAERQPS
ncbi:hypothetical protein HS088_TW04G01303 [Tripterygium wilfordii]|uniref:PWWP domain-containing protein n=1 Tax=Tripterygium wilfordii TaxID=458696 RepID=A0A7J7DSJ8_TRIWF|nr:uncharacterized protein At1g51745-like [Tripterygium wilfordii]KAF5749335.1 hypothetical protein HS088_TW04G01303 [Tripterygium wilfordii]